MEFVRIKTNENFILFFIVLNGKVDMIVRRIDSEGSVANLFVDTFDGAKPRFLNRGKKRRSVSTLSIPRASDRGVEWVDLMRDSLIEWGLLIGAGIPLLPLGLSIGRKGDANVTQT